ncbi:riboflavin synthase subunit alpha [Corynebacterium imitans]|uniref:Riboflavin synthase n=1 Tax=Corynebacterium imitans TaxID=156978 RepID=A0A076NPG7_9CORY|nr:riboflavin synthase [Corynebacterium imitans]AIJ33630.1 riboflavin synthase subunit alpha [Corynebacterium imitans]SNV73219.1 riboflavin synthase subunit alpha [Corynebacterium imitans]
MFTGLIEEVGTIEAVELGETDARVCIRAPKVTEDARNGDSIAVDGVCLTVTGLPEALEDGQPRPERFWADVMPETMRRTRLGLANQGTSLEGVRVNLERALKVGDRLGGHIVQGHVDGVAELLSRTPGPRWDVLRFSLPEGLRRYVVEKGSIAVNGTSLTVSAVGDDFFEVSLIPTTLAETTAGELRVGEPVNLEVDQVAKYVENMVRAKVNDYE